MRPLGLLARSRGVVRAECAGGYFEKFLSEALAAGVEPFDIAFGKGAASFCVAAAKYKRLRAAARRNQCRMRIVEKRGLVFALRRIKSFVPLCVGLLVMIGVMALLGETVVAIDINGASGVSRAEIMASLERSGLYLGMPQSLVDVKLTEQLALIDNKRLSWAAVNLSYGRAEVELRDKLDGAPASDAPAGGIIVAKRDAQITRVIVTSGEAEVKPGEVVAAGQRLVAQAQYLNEASWTARAAASVRGRTHYTERFEAGLFHVYRERTGRSKRVCALSLGGFSLPLGREESPYRWFDTMRYSEPVTIFSFELPLRLDTLEYFEISQRTERLNAARARELLENVRSLYEREALAGADILYKNAEFSSADSGFALAVEYICEEEIGVYFYP